MDILDVNDETFNFNLVADNGNHGEISEIGENSNKPPFIKVATIKGPIAIFVERKEDKLNPGKPCSLTFTQLKEGWLHIDESNCDVYKGNGIYFKGDYERGGSIMQRPI